MAESELTISPQDIANLLLVLRAVERLPIVTEGILVATSLGEPYETLCGQIRTLHANLVEIAGFAAQANVSDMPTVNVALEASQAR